ncbi:transporter substrate-binding domain-containing protein [Sinorhizobium meliloti]|uniref:transporter substrate-binding domain-containing protein n=1 Tax=Rhizobium meliloti TaxID=382 RepID=UPI002091AC6B|nr:transporter substrate-binding domain-containing protein [Sinorhizobium meliloti]MCO5963710.1 transporter substrate-binding domain-containing protein [Sinorhizobium meliloti]
MRALFVRLILLALAPADALADVSSATQRAEEVTIGVRDDARPFIWWDPDTKEYLGFFWDVCTEAVQRAGYRFHEVKVEAGKRADFLITGAGDFDLLCDPTTITLKRMQNFAYDGRAPALEFSPIIFVANGSYVQQQRAAAPKASGVLPKETSETSTCRQILRWLQNTGKDPEGRTLPFGGLPGNQGTNPEEMISGESAADGLLAWLERRFEFTLRRRAQANSAKTKTFEVWGYVEGSTIGEILEAQAARRSQNNWMVCPQALPSHSRAAEEFCAGNLARYFGDVDIIEAALADHRERTTSVCPADTPNITERTYEPYAFVVSSRRFPDFPERLTLALYGMFEDGTVERFFAGHFPEKKKSQHLSTLFRINSIPEGTDTPPPPCPVARYESHARRHCTRE